MIFERGRQMKKGILLLIILVLLVVCVLIGCQKKEESEGQENTPSAPEGSSETVSTGYSFKAFLGAKINGAQTKEMLSQVSEYNGQASADKMISVDLDAFKGIVTGSNEVDKINTLKNYIGNQFSLYEIAYDGEVENQTVTAIHIKQIQGNKEDPEIPIQTEPEFPIVDFIPAEAE